MADPKSGPNKACDEEVKLARESLRALSSYLQTDARTRRIDIVDEQGQSHSVPLTGSALYLLRDALTEIAEGNAVGIVSPRADLTSREAADLLNVSTGFIQELIERGEIPCRLVGSQRMILHSDASAFKERIDSERKEVLDSLVEQAQNLQMGYE